MMALSTRQAAAGTAGLGFIPFAVLSLSFVVDGPIFPGFALQGFMVWSAVVLSFIGAVRWGAALNLGKSAPLEMMFGVLPSMAAWAAVVMDVRFGLLVLVAGYLGTWLLDRFRPQPTAPDWYLPLRTVLTIAVIATHLLMLWAVGF